MKLNVNKYFKGFWVNILNEKKNQKKKEEMEWAIAQLF